MPQQAFKQSDLDLVLSYLDPDGMATNGQKVVYTCLAEAIRAKLNAEVETACTPLMDALETINAMGGTNEAPTVFKRVWRETMLAAQRGIELYKKMKGQ